MAKKTTSTTADAAKAVAMEAAAEMASTTEEEATVENEPAAEKETAEVLQLVYIGPSIPKSGLRHGTILRNTQEEINAFLAKFSERYPEIKYLLVPPKHLPAAQKKVRTKGNILYKYYQDTAAKALTFRRGK